MTSVCTHCYSALLGGPRCQYHAPPRRRLIGWRVRWEKFAGHLQTWVGGKTAMLARGDATVRAKRLRENTRWYRNVRVMRVFKVRRGK